MATVTLAGNPVTVNGDFPHTGATAKPFSLVNKELADVTLASFSGKRKVLNIFPSGTNGGIDAWENVQHFTFTAERGQCYISPLFIDQ